MASLCLLWQGGRAGYTEKKRMGRIAPLMLAVFIFYWAEKKGYGAAPKSLRVKGQLLPYTIYLNKGVG